MYECFFLLAFIPLLTGCGSPPSAESSSSYRVIKEHAQLEKKKHNLDLVAIGGSCPDKLRGLTADYACYRQVDIAEARRLLVDVANDLLKLANSDPGLRPIMANYPFTIDNLDIGILFFKKFGTYMDPPYVALVSSVEGKGCLYYAFNDPVHHKFADEDYNETYAEAVRIVETEKAQQKASP